LKRTLALTLHVLLITNAFGQKYVDIAKFWYGNSSLNKFDNSTASTRLQEVGVDVTMPFVVNSSDAVLSGLFYERITTRLFEDDPETTVSVIGVRAGMSKKHSDKWSGTYLLIPKIASDFEHIGTQDFQVGAIALLKYTRSDKKNYKVGLYYNSELFGPFVVPLFGIYYLSENEKFETNLTLPFLADMNYKLHERLNIGLNFNGQVRSYHLTEVSSTSLPGYLVKATNELYSYLKFNLTESLSIQTRLGYSVGRNYRVYDENDKITFGTMLIKVGDDRTQLNTDFSDGFIYQATVLYRFITQ